MCGIVGTVVASGERVDLSTALTALAHRGPDAVGEHHSPGVSIGHTRLSIIDLSAAASQPMTIEGCGTIALNGEIYDHEVHRAFLEGEGETFRTRSDTEVLLRGLARHGVPFLRRLHGMYAFAWLDASGKRLSLGRDHAGIKPLYFWHSGRTFAFASEVRALAKTLQAISKAVRPNVGALASFLAWGSVPEPLTVLEQVEMVPADHVLEVDVQEARVAREVDVRRRAAHLDGSRDEADAIALTKNMMKDAVRRHLVADHPVALFLSSGVDSGVLGVEMVRAGHPHAINMVLGSQGTSDEPELVRAFAKRQGIPLEQVPIGDWRSRVSAALDAYDQPSIDGINTFLVAGAAKSLGYRVALSGVGADEVFGGYEHLHGWKARLPGGLAFGAVGRTVGEVLERGVGPTRRIGLLLEGAAAGLPTQRGWRRLFSDSEIRSFLPGAPAPVTCIPSRDPLELEQATYLRDTLLRDTDVMGMAHGVEIRAPYLDPGVLEVAASIGTAALLRRDRSPKWLLREGWRHDLEAQTLERRKTGFTLDMGAWLRSEGTPHLNDARQVLERSAVVNRAVLSKQWPRWLGRLQLAHPNAWTPLFAMIQLAAQLRRWGDP